MPPRATRSNAGATPGRSGRGASPSGSSVRSSDPRRLDAIRSPLTAKHSISYGSPLTQLPERATAVGDARVTSAAAHVFKQVRKDNLISQGRRDATQKSALAAKNAATTQSSTSTTQSSVEDDVELVQNPDDEVDELADDGPVGQEAPEGDDDEVMEEAEDQDEEESLELEEEEEEEEEESEAESREGEGEEADEDGEEEAEDEVEVQDKVEVRDKFEFQDNGPSRTDELWRIHQRRIQEAKEAGELPPPPPMRPPEMLPSEWKPFPFSRRSRFGDDGPRLVTREPKLAKAARKRKNDEVEAEKDLDRIAREARRRQERTDEFNRQADERRANEEETSRLAPPIAAPGTRRLPATPFGTTGGNRQSSVPNSVRSWQEEGNVYGGANVGSSPLDPGAAAGEQQHAKLPPPQLPNPDPRLPLQHLIDSARRSQLPAPLEPPERLSQAHGTGGPFAPSKHNNMFVQRGFDQYLGSLGRPLSTLPGVPKPPSASLGQHQRDRDATLGKENGEPDHSSSSSESSPDNRRRRRRGESPEDDEESENEAQNVPKHDHAGRVSSSAVPDDRGSFWSWLKRVSTWRNMCWLFTFYVIMMLAFQHLPAEFPHIRSRSQSSVLSDEQFDRLNEFLKDPSHLTPGARENLKALLPGMIHVQRDRKGKLVIDKEFWHAIKERIQADESVLTLDDRYRLSERHWKALKDQFPVATAPPVVQSWETWLKQNEKKVINLVGKHFDDLVKERLPPNVVSNDEFLRELEAGLAKQKKAMAGDLDDIKATMRSLVDDITKLKSSPKGMSEAEVSRLVDRVVNKAIGRAQLRHAAKNNIAGSLDPELQNRINYFAFGNGASIDSSLTSPTVKIGAVPRVPSESWYKKTMKQPAFIREGHAALSPWQEAGQCWCAAIMGSDNKTFPGDVGVQTSNLIIPEFIVLEHINPAETNDPGAMPKDIELWADIIEPQRKIVRDWAVVSFPRTYTEPDVHDKASDMRLVKIAEFTYKYDAATNGAFVKRLSPQLVEPLQAATDTFLIRARSNHGADHTCFYRIRMYGQNYDIMENIEGEEQRAEEVFEEETPAWRFWN